MFYKGIIYLDSVITNETLGIVPISITKFRSEIVARTAFISVKKKFH